MGDKFHFHSRGDARTNNKWSHAPTGDNLPLNEDTRTQLILQSSALARSVENNSAGNMACHDLEYYKKYVRKTHCSSNRPQTHQEKHVCKRQGPGPKRNKYIAHRAPTGSRSRQETDLGQRVGQVASYHRGLVHVTNHVQVEKVPPWGYLQKRPVLWVGARVSRGCLCPR